MIKKDVQIILLDDDKSVVDLVNLSLSEQNRYNYTLKHFENLGVFIDFIDGEDFIEESSIALLDISLGDNENGGFEAAAILNERGVSIPLIFLSESSLNDDIERSAEVGSNAFLNKLRLSRYPKGLMEAIAQAEGAQERHHRERLGELNKWGNRAVVVVGALDHEIQNLLSPIMVAGLALKTRLDSNEEIDRDTMLRSIDIIISAASEANSLLRNSLSFVRGNVPEYPSEEIDLVSFVEQVISSQYDIDSCKIRLFCGYKSIPISANRMNIKQIVVNLINNAINHGKSIHGIDVSIFFDGEGVKVSVRDYGHTRLSRSEVRRLWEPLRRGANAQGSGGGMGLSVIKYFSEMHAGFSFHDYPEEGTGNIFGICLPKSSNC